MNLSNRRILSSLLVVAFSGWLVACGAPTSAEQAQFSAAALPESITVSEVSEYPQALLLDVRTRREWDAGHLMGALHLPVGDINAGSVKLLPADKPIIVYCAAGVRATRAVEALRELGFTAVAVREGGFRDLKTLLPTAL